MHTTMMEAVVEKKLNDPEIKAAIQALRQTDNYRNWWYLGCTYLFLTLVIGGAVLFYDWQARAGISFWWNLPVSFCAIILVGAGQHQLSGLAHEGVHHILFRNRLLNDLASDLLTMFPLFSSTYHYRLQHLAHHQFVNDPERDPDISQLKSSGHWLNFPISKSEFFRVLRKQMWFPRLIRYMRVRATYNATGTDKNPYLMKERPPSKVAVRIGLAYLIGLFGALFGLFYKAEPQFLILVPTGMWVGISLIFLFLPTAQFHRSRIHPVIPLRWMTILRLAYFTYLFASLTYITRTTDQPAIIFYFILWIVPIFSSFSFFMILRQIVQHGNGDRGWLTNTRSFFVAPFFRYAIFPMGQHLHLPHHMYATVPHYRLGKLHQLLMTVPEYRQNAVVVEGYFVPPQTPQTSPTVVEVLGPEIAARHSANIHIDNTVMDGDQFENRLEMLEETQKLCSMNNHYHSEKPSRDESGG